MNIVATTLFLTTSAILLASAARDDIELFKKLTLINALVEPKQARRDHEKIFESLPNMFGDAFADYKDKKPKKKAKKPALEDIEEEIEEVTENENVYEAEEVNVTPIYKPDTDSI